jgi:hypothetical protein
MQPSTGQEAASFQHLPAHLQTHIFGLASAPLLVCKASLAILSDGALVARWFIANKLSPFLAAALARQWEACWHMLDSQCYKPSKWQIVAAVDSAAAHGQLELVQALLDRGARRMLRKFDEEPNFQVCLTPCIQQAWPSVGAVQNNVTCHLSVSSVHAGHWP